MYQILKKAVILMLVILLAFAIIFLVLFLYQKDSFLKDAGTVFSITFSAIAILFGSLTYFSNRESTERAQIDKYYSNLNDEINATTFDNKKGVDAYLEFKLGTPVKNVVLDNLNLVLLSYEMYLTLIRKNPIVANSYKSFSITKLHLLFYSRLLWPLHETIIKDGRSFILEKHDDSRITLPKFIDLSIMCVNYLLDNKIVQQSDFKKQVIEDLHKVKKVI